MKTRIEPGARAALVLMWMTLTHRERVVVMQRVSDAALDDHIAYAEKFSTLIAGIRGRSAGDSADAMHAAAVQDIAECAIEERAARQARKENAP